MFFQQKDYRLRKLYYSTDFVGFCFLLKLVFIFAVVVVLVWQWHICYGIFNARVANVCHFRIDNRSLIKYILAPQQHFDEYIKLGIWFDIFILEYGRIDFTCQALPLHGMQEVGEWRLIWIIKSQKCHCAFQFFLHLATDFTIFA